MRVTIEHREESAGLTGATKHYFVDCAVAFSEEEKAIIKTRDLYGHNFTVGPATPISSPAAYAGSGALNSLGRLMLVGGGILLLISPLIGEMPYGPLGFFGAIAGGVLWAFAAWKMRQQDNRISDPDQVIKLRSLLSGRPFTVYASSPAGAQEIDDDIRAALGNTKELIVASSEIKAKQTFEL